ncbi:hypothetical protein [Dubosiella newyorkensis]|uniref:hypothetical protein n=1 Tax=Dubosiella newyorkensis TaxID=1862672 RepID=UPI0026F3D701|nr:hypothetical protein [Dubosiella newyorkensis]
MNYAMICETPYQLLNILNFIYTETQYEDVIDIYINIVNKGMNNFYQKLRKNNRIRNICSYTSPQRSEGNLKYKYRRILEYFFPVASLNYSLSDKILNNKNLYDVIILAFPNPLVVNFCSIYSNADVWFIEDGTGSYHGRIGNAIDSNIARLINPILHKGPEYIHPSRLYVYKPEICKSEYNDLKICRLNPVRQDSKYYINIVEVFGNVSNKNDYRITYISQPLNIKEYTVYERNIFKKIWGMESNLTVRIHPTEKLKDYLEYPELCVDDGSYQWEVQCETQISDNSILIGTCSTAQITPILIYGKEPFLIFTLYLYKNVIPFDLLKRWEQLVMDVKRLYADPNKIFIPKNEAELLKCLKNLKNII